MVPRDIYSQRLTASKELFHGQGCPFLFKSFEVSIPRAGISGNPRDLHTSKLAQAN